MTVSGNNFITGLLVLGLSACGGGGGGGDSGPPGDGTTNRAPIANAGADQSVDEQSTVILDGSASRDPDNNTLTYGWTQTGGESVALSGANASLASFDGPNVGIGSSTTLTFRLRVTDTSGASGTATVDVVVNGVSNSDPVVNAGEDLVVMPASVVRLDGFGNDPDIGDNLTYSWTQIGGTNVSLLNSDQQDASFNAPAAASSGGGGGSSVSVSGRVKYEFVPPSLACDGLDFLAIETRPIRAATVQLIDAGETLTFQLDVSDGIATVSDTVRVDVTGPVVDSTTSADNGDYFFPAIPENIDARLRVRAELKRSGTPGWDVELRDNVDTSPNPPPLSARPLYVIDSSEFNTGTSGLTFDLTATTGWDGTSYTGTRAAAPFAILDAVYSGMKLVLTADADANFGPLDAFWSVNNTLTGSTDIDAGELPSSFYLSSIDSLFLLGDANTDTEEFDDHVVVHEWGHYFEDVFSRSDSTGGPHGIGESIDARLAFGEGWATALAAIALDDPIYCDTGPAGSPSGFDINTETNNFGPQGWFNEMSVATLIYDLYDTNPDGTDSGSIGFGSIFDTMAGPQRSTQAFTSLFSFATELRAQLDPADQAFLDSQLSRENIETAGLDIWGSSQGSIMTSPNQERDVLPLYTTLPVNGDVLNICTNSDYDSGRNGNKLAERRFLRFTTTSSAAYTVTISTTTPTPPTNDPPPTPPDEIRDQSDPDMFIYRRGEIVAIGNGPDANSEVFTTPVLPAGTYVVDLQEWRYSDQGGASSDFPEQICFDVSMTPQ